MNEERIIRMWRKLAGGGAQRVQPTGTTLPVPILENRHVEPSV
jgi:hypothetical protein